MRADPGAMFCLFFRLLAPETALSSRALIEKVATEYENKTYFDLHICAERKLVNSNAGSTWLWLLGEDLGVGGIDCSKVFHVC